MMPSQLARRSVILGIAATSLASCSEARKANGVPPTPVTAKKSKLTVSGLIEIKASLPGICLDLRYATANNFTGRPLYKQARAFLQNVATEALLRARDRAMQEGFGLTLFDAYRPWSVTRQLWEATPRTQRDYVANPKRGSRHNRGCAIDLSLHALKTGGLVEMPSAFDDFSERAHRDFMAASGGAIANRARLERYMEAEGFIGMPNEWWHFDYRGWEKFPVLDVAFEDL